MASTTLRPKSEDAPERFVFVLLDNFTLLSFASALDALRIANRMLGRTAYEWIFIGEGGETVQCSAGTTFAVDDDLCELRRDDVMILCGGVDIQMATTKTTAGGTSSIDLMLKMIADKHGEEMANAVADQMIYSSIRTDQDTQRLSVPTRIGVRHPKLSQVIQMMEQNIEEPISPAVLAKDVGMSTRQLERLFRRYLNRSPKRYYMELRLQKARNLLMQTDMSVINVALACGFASPSHFSKCYRAHYETTPYRERGSHAQRISI
ncbi:MAG: helix-turn-helix domain-containing protein [Rhodobacteraceae bacterium]|nr:helix-turn-helix domain-containing protein [Paracoccaceae bacterium]